MEQGQSIDNARNSPFSRFVENIRVTARTDGRARRVDRLPDGRTALILRVREPGRSGDLTVAGPRTRALLKDATGFAYAVSFDFKPGWSTPVLGVPANQLTDAYVTLEDLWGRAAQDLVFALLSATTVADMTEHVSRAIRRRGQLEEPTTARLARLAARLMESEDARMESIAGRLGVTARHLRRAFSENIGITPKDFARAARLQRAMQLRAASDDWSHIAADAGYYDQAHLIADFRALVGLTPSAYLKRASDPNPLQEPV